jgi:hypothetical protein
MRKSILVLTAAVALVVISCKENPYINAPGDNSYNYDSIPVLKADTDGIVIGIDSAVAICNALAKDEETSERYKLSGTISSIKTDLTKVPNTYTNIDFMLTDKKGTITCFRTNYLNNYPFRSRSEMPPVGSKVTVVGNLVNYSGTTPEIKNSFILRIDSLANAAE